MIVVADTSPLNYLVLLGHIDILAKIYAEVLVPQTVLDELQDSDAPAGVRAWAVAPEAVKSRPIEAERPSSGTSAFAGFRLQRRGDGSELAVIRQHPHTGRPLGTGEFIQDQEKAMQRRITLQKRGPRER